MKKSKKLRIVSQYYKNGLWGIERVHDAVIKNWITAEEFEEITGEAYDER